jgi:hypothetical protein
MTGLVRVLVVSPAQWSMLEKLHLTQSGLWGVHALVIVSAKGVWQLTFAVCERGALRALGFARRGKVVQSKAQCFGQCRATKKKRSAWRVFLMRTTRKTAIYKNGGYDEVSSMTNGSATGKE